MVGWFFFAIVALLLLGTQRFLYKVAAARGCNIGLATFTFMTTVALMSCAVFVIRGRLSGNISFLLIISFINSGSFVAATMAHMEALKRLSTTAVYSVIRLNVVVVVLFSIVYFGDVLSFYQIVGIGIAVLVLLIFTHDSKKQEGERTTRKAGWIFVSVSLLAGAIATISSKFAAVGTDKVAFMAVSYGFSALFSYLARNRIYERSDDDDQKTSIGIGVTMGLINFAGYYSFLKALTTGPLSIIVPIVGMHFVIAIVLSVLLFNERLTLPRVVGVSLAISSIPLLRL